MATLNVSGRTFREEFEAYERWLRATVKNAGLSWQRAAVFERPFGPSDGRRWTPGTELGDLDSFEERFRDILASSDGGWVNLEAETIFNGLLIVALVWRPLAVGYRTLPVSVNHSGFAAAEAARLRQTLRPE